MSRRVKVLIIDPDLFVRFMREGSDIRIVANALPSDAKVVGVGSSQRWHYSPDYAGIALTIESEWFPEVPEGSMCELLPPVYFEKIQQEHESRSGSEAR